MRMSNSISVKFRVDDKHNPNETMAPEPLMCEVKMEYKEDPADMIAYIVLGNDNLAMHQSRVVLTRTQFNRMVENVNRVFEESPATHPVSSR